jgi:4-amino-4-deoxy-L-arabinose transferase-like glycosyltransferase
VSAPRAGLRPARLLALLVLAFTVLAGSAMLRTSTTFDEIVLAAAGARALRTGDFAMVNDHPRLLLYAYGLPIHLSGARFPAEEGRNWWWYTRYHYARALYWESGNSPERIAAATRLVGLAFGALAVVATFLVARRHMDEWGALLAAGLLAFLPDFLAHSGVAYNDVPLAFALLVSVYAVDAAIRRPTPGRAALAGLACAAAACIKYSGLIAVPIAAVLVALEAASGRWRDGRWLRELARGAAVFAIAGYAFVALSYGGDWTLREFRLGLEALGRWTSTGRVAFLLGERNVGGWWYFFPAALALKTPLALQVLALLAAGGGVLAARGGRWRGWLTHGARAPAVAAAVLLAALLASRVNIGVRHALPMWPFACILVAQGLQGFWQRGSPALRATLGLVTAAFFASSAASYPWFFSYLGAWAQGRPTIQVLVDSSTDWGQGLVALRDYMRANGIDRVALAYFGSALPEGYGIAHVPLPSFLELPPQPAGSPRYAVVSATLLAGLYVKDDPYAVLRARKPVAIVAGSLYVYDLAEGGRAGP